MNRGLFGTRAIVLMVLAAALALTGLTVSALTSREPTAAADGAVRGPLLADTMPQVRYGQGGVDVLTLQLGLRAQGHQLNGTGFYGDRTLAAVRKFQRAEGIKDSGIVGPKTWGALLLDRQLKLSSIPDRTLAPSTLDKRGMRALILRLGLIHPYAGELPNVTDEYYGLDWQSMVMDFQRRAGINPTGVVGTRTWYAMHKVIAASTGWTG